MRGKEEKGAGLDDMLIQTSELETQGGVEGESSVFLLGSRNSVSHFSYYNSSYYHYTGKDKYDTKVSRAVSILL